MSKLKALAKELGAAEAFLALACIGWGLSSDTLALFGCLGALAIIALHLWQRYCLAGLSYRRRLERSRASFGEEVGLELEIVNDKPLPLSYVGTDDEVPSALPIEGGTVIAGFDRSATLVQVLPLLPYQRVRRRLVVHCDRRGDYRFGPARLTSGDPVGRRTRSVQLYDQERLLVHPKVFALTPDGIASRLLYGDERSRFELTTDPSRIAGVRAYEVGDPVRHIAWRATARVGSLLVRRFEPTVSPRVAVALDVQVPQLRNWFPRPDELEFVIATAASLVVALMGARVPVGLYANNARGGLPLAHVPSRAPSALAEMMESLARLVPDGSPSVAGLLTSLSATMPHQTSVVIVAADFPAPTLTAIAELRRRHAVSAVYLSTSAGRQPPRERVDVLLRARYVDDWHERTTLELSS